ncbi:MAG: hypothetical protein JEY94_05550 [Melioribacteraceae bacterium]|nr:hypothetical protein [Melioribacteraceae bacterium]
MRNFAGSSRSEKSKDSKKRDNKRSGKSTMHKATCSSCGKDCTVPFAPTSGKPIFCSNCFDKHENEDSRKSGRDRGDRKFKSGDSRKRSFNDRDSAMYNVVCDSCGKDCEVPFRPTQGKPIYCDKCFGNEKGSENRNNTDQFKKEFAVLNKKLDRILEILMPDNDQDELE